MFIDVDRKINIPPPAPSYSTMGKTNDVANKSDVVRNARKGGSSVKVRSWEGMEMVERMLQEIGGSSGAGRAQPLLSSPRVSPAIVERDATESADQLMRSFLTKTAMKMNLQDMPAARAISPERGQAATAPLVSPSSSPTRKKKKKGVSKKVSKTAAFLAPPRPSPDAEFQGRGPDVGKYTPKYSVVERHPEGVSIPHHDNATKPRARSPGHQSSLNHTMRSAVSASEESTTFALTQTGGQKRAATAEASPEAEKGDGSPHNQSSRALANKKAAELEPKEWRKHEVRDVSSAFKAVGRKEEVSHTVDLDYWPFPRPGTTSYAQGRITPGTRTTTADLRTGCGPNTMYYVEDRYRPASVISFDKTVSRDDVKVASPFGNPPKQMLEYHPNPDSLSTKPRLYKGYTDFKKQKGRPPTTPTPGSNVEPLGLYYNSVASSKKLGHIDFSRRSGRSKENPLFEDETRPMSVLNVDASVIQRRPGSVIFSTAEKKSVLGENRSNTPEYFPSYEAVSRHRPVAFLKGTSRDAPVLHEGQPTLRKEESPIDLDTFDRSRHIPSPTMTRQLSRDARNKVLSPPAHASDVVYDVKVPQGRAITFSRLARR